MTDHAVLLGRGGFGFVRPARPRRQKAGTAERGGTGVWPAATKIISKQGLALGLTFVRHKSRFERFNPP